MPEDGVFAGTRGASSVPPWETGSFFAWDETSLRVRRSGAAVDRWWHPSAEAYACGTGALAGLIDAQTDRGTGTRPRLHLPSFFCMGTANELARVAELRWYRELPDGRGPELGSVDAVPGDLVLAVDLFGRSRQEPWDQWRHANPDVLVVEDHTHDPLSRWAQESTSAWCVASLRKSLPVPDGALLWSPTGHRVPRPPQVTGGGAGSDRWSAMIMKAAWLDGYDLDVDQVRRLETEAEQRLAREKGAAVPVTLQLLGALDVQRLQSRRGRNVELLTQLLDSGPTRPWVLMRHTAAGSTPFNLQLLCETPAHRDALRAHLLRHRVYAPIHWSQPAAGGSGHPAAVDVAARILTLPCDHRYGTDDMMRVADLVLAWTP